MNPVDRMDVVGRDRRKRDRWCDTCGTITNHTADEHPRREIKRESEEDRLRRQLEGAVEALREIAAWAEYGYQDLNSGGVLSCVKKRAKAALTDVGGQHA